MYCCKLYCCKLSLVIFLFWSLFLFVFTFVCHSLQCTDEKVCFRILFNSSFQKVDSWSIKPNNILHLLQFVPRIDIDGWPSIAGHGIKTSSLVRSSSVFLVYTSPWQVWALAAADLPASKSHRLPMPFCTDCLRSLDGLAVLFSISSSPKLLSWSGWVWQNIWVIKGPDKSIRLSAILCMSVAFGILTATVTLGFPI